MVALRRRRDEKILELCDHFTAGNLEAEELEALIDAAHAADAIGELDALTAGLPALVGRDGPDAGVALAPAGSVRDHAAVLAVMSGVERKGAWVPARQNYVVALMGGVELDFREARMPAGVTEVYVLALMGGVEILVPPGLRVESSGIGIMGGFDHAGGADPPTDVETPILRISGAGVMGGVEIRERLAGESASEARRRRKQERRDLRRGGTSIDI